ncbi:hypothetical protein FCOIX_3911 [Fusarium coicis]|nr:hypothetical protein FCOIX_3911 [Fusarium coicis]
MKTAFVFGMLALALQSRACVTFTTKEDIKAQKYTWAVWKDGQKQCQFNGQGNRPNSLFGDVDDEDYYVILSNDFPTLHGQVFKFEYGEFKWNPEVTMQQFEDFGDTRRACLHGGVNCAGKPCNLP